MARSRLTTPLAIGGTGIAALLGYSYTRGTRSRHGGGDEAQQLPSSRPQEHAGADAEANAADQRRRKADARRAQGLGGAGAGGPATSGHELGQPSSGGVRRGDEHGERRTRSSADPADLPSGGIGRGRGGGGGNNASIVDIGGSGPGSGGTGSAIASKIGGMFAGGEDEDKGSAPQNTKPSSVRQEGDRGTSGWSLSPGGQGAADSGPADVDDPKNTKIKSHEPHHATKKNTGQKNFGD